MAAGVGGHERLINGQGLEVEGKITAAVVITCIVAASGGLIFGYDIGISGMYLSSVFIL